MKIKDLIHRARMQIGDTSKLDITDYQLLELYNHGNQLVARLLSKYVPSMVQKRKLVMYNEYTRPPDVLYPISLTVDGEETDASVDSLSFNDGKDHEIEFDYVPSVGYKDITDESGYISEIESLLVDYVVGRTLNANINFEAEWYSFFMNLGASNSAYVERRGYWDHDNRRTDYPD